MPILPVTNRRLRSNQRGISLIELLVALAIVALLLGVVTVSLNDLFETNLKKTTARLGSTLKYLYNKSVTERLYLRVVFDLDKKTYWVESTNEVYVINPEVEQKIAEEGFEEAEKDGEKEKKEDSHFSKDESYLLKPIKLPTGVIFQDVQPSYIEGKVKQGRAYLYFFPNGYATPTVINFSDEDEEVFYSMQVFAYSGRVRIINEYKELEREAL
jgi:general secretion pathway protein H